MLWAGKSFLSFLGVGAVRAAAGTRDSMKGLTAARHDVLKSVAKAPMAIGAAEGFVESQV